MKEEQETFLPSFAVSDNFTTAGLCYRNWLTHINRSLDVIPGYFRQKHKNSCKSFLGEWNYILNVLMELTDLKETCAKFKFFFFCIVHPFTTWTIELFVSLEQSHLTKTRLWIGEFHDLNQYSKKETLQFVNHHVFVKPPQWSFDECVRIVRLLGISKQVITDF